MYAPVFGHRVAQVRGSVSSAKTARAARSANQGAVDGGTGGSALPLTDGYHPMGTPAVQLKVHVVDLPPTAGVTQYTPAFYAYNTDGQTGPLDTNATTPLTWSTIRVNATVGAPSARLEMPSVPRLQARQPLFLLFSAL